MKQIKRILAALFVAASVLALAVSCTSDKADNPKFEKGEVYIYCNLPQNIAATVGEATSFTLLVSPNDGSVDCRWLLDGTLIADTPSFEYTFLTSGSFSLRFEAEKDGKVNYRQFNLTVAE